MNDRQHPPPRPPPPPISRPQFAARAALVGRDRRGDRGARRRDPGRRAQRGDAAVLELHEALRRRSAPAAVADAGDSRRPNCGPRSTACPPRSATRCRPPRDRVRSYHERQLEAMRRKLELPRRRRHAARPEGHAAGPGRHLRAGRQGGVSVERADERDSGAGGRRRRDRHGRADAAAARRNALVLAAAARGRRRPRVHDRRRAGGGGAGLRHGDDAARGQDHRPRQRLCRQRQAARVRPGRHRHDRRARARSWCSPTAARRPTGSRWTCSARPSTTNWRRASCCAPMPAYIDRGAGRDRPAAAGRCRAREIIRASLEGRGALIQTRIMEEACEISNRIAPEHLEVSSRDPHRWEPLLRHAGAIFLGAFTSESLGDYCAGPNHVLPTARHRALLVAAGRLRFPEAQQPDRGQRGRRADARADRRRAGLRRRAAGARARAPRCGLQAMKSR